MKKSSSSLGGGASPNTSSLPQGSWGGSGLLRSSSGRSSSLGAERRWPPGSAGRRQLRERAQALGRCSSGGCQDGGNRRAEPEPPGTDFLPSSAPRQPGEACSKGRRVRRGLGLGPGGGGSPGTRQAQRGKRASRGRSQEPTAPRPLIVSPLPPGGKQEARRLAERRTGAGTNEHGGRRARRRMSAGKRGGTSGRAVTLFPPFGLEAPPFVFPAQSIKIGKKKIPGPLRPCPPPLPASSPAAAAFASHHV